MRLHKFSTHYEYEVDGIAYDGVFVNDRSVSKGTKVRLYYDANNPSESKDAVALRQESESETNTTTQEGEISMWSEIRNDFYNDVDGKIYIDAWVSDSNDEEGRVIAKIDIVTKEVEYLDEAAKSDPYAQLIINDALQAIKDGIYDEDIEARLNRQ